MASTYSDRLRIELIGTGEQSGTWGNTTNTNLGTLIEEAIAGVVTISMSDANYTLTTANGATDESRQAVLQMTGSLSTTRDVICPAEEKVYIIKNGTTGGQSIVLKTSGGTGVTVPNGKTMLVYCDGTNVVTGNDALTSIAVAGNATVTGTLTVDGATSLDDSVVINESGADKDFRVEGDTDANLLFTDASADAVGIGTSSPSAKLDVNGNVAITGTGRRITGDFSNATVANRLMFQTSTANSPTRLGAIPSGTGQIAALNLYNSSDPSNSSFLGSVVNASDCQIIAGSIGTGVNFPLTFYTGGSERVRIDTSGNVGIGTSSPSYKLHVNATAYASNWMLPDGGYLFWGNGAASILGNNNTVSFLTTSTERLRIDASGNVGIGTTSINKKFVVSNAGAAGIELDPFGRSQETASSILSYNRSVSAYIPLHLDASVQQFYISGTERARIDADGQFIVGSNTSVGTTAPLQARGRSSTTFAAAFDKGDATVYTVALNRSDDGGVMQFYRAWSGGGVGGISITSSSTSYNTSSDYRLKENVQPMQNALAKVSALNPVTYNWKLDGSDGQGFIAHELQAVIPDAVTGEKDAVDKDGKPIYQGVDPSKIVATLVAAVQELNEKLEAANARIASLENT